MAVVLNFPLWVTICSKLSIQCSPIVFNRRFYRPVKEYFISRCTRDCFLAENMPRDEGSWDTANGVGNLQK